MYFLFLSPALFLGIAAYYDLKKPDVPFPVYPILVLLGFVINIANIFTYELPILLQYNIIGFFAPYLFYGFLKKKMHINRGYIHLSAAAGLIFGIFGLGYLAFVCGMVFLLYYFLTKREGFPFAAVLFPAALSLYFIFMLFPYWFSVAEGSVIY